MVCTSFYLDGLPGKGVDFQKRKMRFINNILHDLKIRNK